MSTAKAKREKKRQLGQFLTPAPVARRMVHDLSFTQDDRVLEPSMGDGSFVLPIIEKFMGLYTGSIEQRLDRVLTRNVYGVEIDENLYRRCLENIEARWGCLPARHNLIQGDFFRQHFLTVETSAAIGAPGIHGIVPFTHIIGNPPFGGTFDRSIEDDLDREYGFRNGEKIKKETYSFFIVKSLELLSRNGRLIFICSDTFLTIKTMRGLRRLLMSLGRIRISDLVSFSDETTHPMVVLDFTKDGYQDAITVNGQRLGRAEIELTENFSWRISQELAKYFRGPLIGRYMIASSGMTIGKNELFVREIRERRIIEPYRFEFFDDPITLERERGRARLGKLSPQKVDEIRRQQAAGETRRNVRVVELDKPVEIELPHPDYCYYNKGISAIVYSPPTHAVFWRDDGDAVLTFKRNGNWYLHGVGGQPYFGREGLTWQLIAQRIHIRYLPAGHILDSGAPCAFLRSGVERDELFFILGWALNAMCNRLLKEVINHTKNIQGKDFERLPYPFWVSGPDKRAIIASIKDMIDETIRGKSYSRNCPEARWLEDKFAFTEGVSAPASDSTPGQLPLPLFE